MSKYKISFVGKFLTAILCLVSFSTNAGAAGMCQADKAKATAGCNTEGLADAVKEATKKKLFASGEALPIANEKLTALKTKLKGQKVICDEAATTCLASCNTEISEANVMIADGITMHAKGVELTSSTALSGPSGAIAGANMKMQGNAMKTTGQTELTSAKEGLGVCQTQQKVQLGKIVSGIGQVGGSLLALAQVAAALGFNLLGNSDSDDFQVAGVDDDPCAGLLGDSLVICNSGNTTTNNSIGGIAGQDGSFSGGRPGGEINLASTGGAPDRPSSSGPAGNALAGAGGGSGGPAGFGSDNGGSGDSDAGAVGAVASTKADIYKGFMGGAGNGAGASGSKGAAGRRFALRERLKKAQTPADKAKVLAQFKADNQLKGKGRGLASSSKDGKAGPFQDNFMIIKKAHKQNYRSLFQK